jgi:HTH-type transcriptional repressor of NAD biosynthesis genes
MKTVGFFAGKFLPWHIGHKFAAITALGYVDKLYIVLTSDKKHDDELCVNAGCKTMPSDDRISWISNDLKDFENIAVIKIDDNNKIDAAYNWEEGARKIVVSIPETITHVFSSEHEYDAKFQILYPNAKSIIIDESRHTVPISATQIRKNISDNWEYLPPSVRQFFIKKVLITGTESVGKSVLVKKLAGVFNTNYVEEIGRLYCKNYKNNLTVDIFDEIAIDHWQAQRKAAVLCNKIMFVDSDAIVTQYYLDMYFQTKSQFIDAIINKQNYDLIIYLEPDVKWIDDGFRFKSKQTERESLNIKLKKMYANFNCPLSIIDGNYQERFIKSYQLIYNCILECGITERFKF